VGQQTSRDLGVEQGAAGGNGAHGVREGAMVDVLEQVAAGARGDPAEHILLVAEGGEDDHGGPGPRLGEAARRLHTVHGRHHHIHQHHVGVEGANLGDRRDPVAGVAHHLNIGLAGEQRLDARADQGLVIDDQDADLLTHRGSSSIGSTMRSRKPPSASGAASIPPPTASARSRRPTRP
jgi:hypothetical protein